MQRINLIGIELEGGWGTEKGAQLSSLRLLKHDGSVSGTGRPHQGEVASPPMVPKAAEEFMRKWYPDSVNQTCGFHIHLSTTSLLDYSRLMSRTFHRHFRKKWKDWGHDVEAPTVFWDRLNGKNRYCQSRFENPDYQVAGEGDRYRQLNFCYGKHKTVEARLLPMFPNMEMGIKAMYYMVDIFEKWLKIQKKERGFAKEVETTRNYEMDIEKPIDSLLKPVELEVEKNLEDVLIGPKTKKVQEFLLRPKQLDLEETRRRYTRVFPSSVLDDGFQDMINAAVVKMWTDIPF